MNKDLITLFYIFDEQQTLDGATKENGFSFKGCIPLSSKDKDARLEGVDLVLIDARKISAHKVINIWKTKVKQISAPVLPAVFIWVSAYPDQADRLMLLENGINDFLISPLNMDEVKCRLDVYRKLDDFRRQCEYKSETKRRLGIYLDRFKNELKSAKKLLYEERLALNNALKQIQQLTAERRRLKKEKKQSKQDLAENIDGFFTMLRRIVKTRVEKNRGHGERVAQIANVLGKNYNLSEQQLEDLRKAAMLHEIGLIFTPMKTLEKSEDQLDDNEKALFIQYPAKSASLLSCCSSFDGCARIIGAMNENSDGTGSPGRLKKRYIPLASRILAGADLFDTLRDDPGIKGPKDLLMQLENFSGTRLDPGIVSRLQQYTVEHIESEQWRVRGVGIHQLEAGMVLGTAIFTHTGTKLFSVNTLLTKDAIDKIKKYNQEYPVDETVYVKA